MKTQTQGAKLPAPDLQVSCDKAGVHTQVCWAWRPTVLPLDYAVLGIEEGVEMQNFRPLII